MLVPDRPRMTLIRRICTDLNAATIHSGAPAVEFVKILLAAKALPLFSKVSGMVEGEAMCKAARPHFFAVDVGPTSILRPKLRSEDQS